MTTPEPTTPEPVMLTIAGSDPSGGAGVQADLKTATAVGVYGASVITALTAQNTTGVQGVHPVPASFVRDQLASVLSDLDVRAVKIGMLGDADLIDVVADALEPLDVPVVLDPVMVATSGDVLVPPEATEAIIDRLVPIADLVTPNLHEAELLAGQPVSRREQMAAAGREINGLGAAATLVKGGHLHHRDRDAEVVDVLVTGDRVLELSHPRVDTPNTHGTGCTLSSAIASRLAVGDGMEAAVRAGEAFLLAALESGRDRRYGGGHGPVDHLWRIR